MNALSWLARVGLFSMLVVPVSAAPQTRAAATRSPSLSVLVTTRTGDPLPDAVVTLEGPVSREGTTAADGTVSFAVVTAGTYRCHVEHDGYLTLEKEIAVKATGRTSAEASLSAAPPPPPAPAAPAALELTPGAPKVIDITDLAAEELKERDPVVERVIGCSGATSARLLRLQESLPARARDDADQMLYVVAGEATLKIGDLNRAISAGSFGIVPRGTSYSVSRRGRNPLILLTVVSGPACVD